MEAKKYKIVTVKHQNCNVPYTFEVPETLDLNVGNYVLCETKTSDIPQVGKCITPSFEILGVQLKEMYGIQPKNLRPVVGLLKPVMHAFVRRDGDDE